MLLTFTDCTAWNSGQRVDTANQTHLLVLVCGKLVLQKSNQGEGKEKSQLAQILERFLNQQLTRNFFDVLVASLKKMSF